MVTRIKRFVVLVFVAFLISDACSYIDYAISNKSFKMLDFYGIYSKMSYGNIYNLAIIYFFIVCVIYFLFNFFRKENN